MSPVRLGLLSLYCAWVLVGCHFSHLLAATRGRRLSSAGFIRLSVQVTTRGLHSLNSVRFLI